ncbi:MAG: ABC transporter permease, partial [Acidimicrobiia bacterium]|nr:ABC transporter permease [Acidimicrobiia bacterium]
MVDVGAPITGKSTRRLHLDRRVVRWLSVVGVVALWEVFGRSAPILASYPSAVVRAFIENVDRILVAFGATLQAVAVGYFLAVTLGVLIGFAMARIRTAKVALNPYVAALYSTPRITLIPVAILFFGIGFELRVLMSVLAAVFPIIINTEAAVNSVSKDLQDTARVFMASRWDVTRTVLIPGSIPGIFVGLRVGIIRALIGVIVAEMTAGAAGIGALLLTFGRFFQAEKLFGPVLLLGFLSILLTQILLALERKATPW